MSTLKIVILPILAGLLVAWLWLQRRRAHIQFVRETLAGDPTRLDTFRVVVSLSTLPDRIPNLQPTLESVINQTRTPDEIVLALPDFSLRQQRPYAVPEYLLSYPRLRIRRCGMDWGPATKFIPIVQEELGAGCGDTRIMVVDDDRIYPRDALESFLHYSRQLPDAALCFRGAPMPRGLKWRKPKLCLGDRIRQPNRVAVIMGCGSYLIQPRFFDARLWDYSDAPSAAFYMDDIWISGWLDRAGVKKYVVPASSMMRTAREQYGTATLDDVPNGRRRSNNEAIRFFADTWNVFLPD